MFHNNLRRKGNGCDTSGDDRNETTADCLSLARVFPSIRTKFIPFSHINS